MINRTTHSSDGSPSLLAEVTRGPAVESRHYGHVAVVDRHGALLFSAGNPQHLLFPRSSLKPLQALAVVSAGAADRFDFSNREIAVICASHSAEPRHREAVREILRRIAAKESDLHCGPHPVSHEPTRDELIKAGEAPSAIFSNCSGKHAGMLALARVLGAPLAGYWDVEHPVQKEVQRVLAAACDAAAAGLQWGIDGCGVPTYLISLRQLALGFARFGAPEALTPADAAAAARITTAMAIEPEMVAGEGRLDSVVMRQLGGVVICKGGAEGCEGAAVLGRGIGIALKVEDGSARAIAPVLLSLLRRFECLPATIPPPLAVLAPAPVLNTRGEPVGEVRACI